MSEQAQAKITETKARAARKILVAVDGSIYSSNALRYVAQLFENMASIEFHLLSLLSHKIDSSQRAWINESDVKSTLGQAGHKDYETARLYLEKAVKLLVRHGIKENQVKAEIKLTRTGIADDLMHEARTGLHDAILIGRRGLGMLQEFVLGSVSDTILQKCHDIPIWLIDGEVDSRRFLVPIDGTVHSLRAVDHLAFILKDNPQAEITLFNSPAMFAGQPTANHQKFDPIWGHDWCDQHLSGPDWLFHAPEQLLAENGFPAERTHRLTTNVGPYPSRQIVRQALIDDFGTIVMGRRPAGTPKGIFRGVSDKVLLMSDQTAIWIVG